MWRGIGAERTRGGGRGGRLPNLALRFCRSNFFSSGENLGSTALPISLTGSSALGHVQANPPLCDHWQQTAKGGHTYLDLLDQSDGLTGLLL